VNSGWAECGSSRGLEDELRFYPDDTEADGLALAFRVLQTRFLCELLRFKGFRQGREFAMNIPKKQPPLDGFGHPKFIARVWFFYPISIGAGNRAEF
jgi:hypothetical protein